MSSFSSFFSFKKNREINFFYYSGSYYSGLWLENEIEIQKKYLKKLLSNKNTDLENNVIALAGKYTPTNIARIIAAADMKMCIALYDENDLDRKKFPSFGVNCLIGKEEEFICFEQVKKKSLYVKLKEKNHSGLILFSSGTSGAVKAILHDFDELLAVKYEKLKIKKTYKIVPMMTLDHIGGLNTLLYSLLSGSCIFITHTNNLDEKIKFIAENKIELLPTTPSFLRIILLGEYYNRYNLSNLKVISYGAEPMEKKILEELVEKFPKVTFKQTYGLTEVGILKTISKSNNSVFFKILKNEGIDYRINNNQLEIRTNSIMLGYLNLDSKKKFDDTESSLSGWYQTGDLVEVDGDFIQVIGRKNEMINMGGIKINPLEVEEVIFSIEEVLDSRVYGVANKVLGSVLVADVSLVKNAEATEKTMVVKIKKHCFENLGKTKTPVLINFVSEVKISNRYKKLR